MRPIRLEPEGDGVRADVQGRIVKRQVVVLSVELHPLGEVQQRVGHPGVRGRPALVGPGEDALAPALLPGDDEPAVVTHVCGRHHVGRAVPAHLDLLAHAGAGKVKPGRIDPIAVAVASRREVVVPPRDQEGTVVHRHVAVVYVPVHPAVPARRDEDRPVDGRAVQRVHLGKDALVVADPREYEEAAVADRQPGPVVAVHLSRRKAPPVGVVRHPGRVVPLLQAIGDHKPPVGPHGHFRIAMVLLPLEVDLDRRADRVALAVEALGEDVVASPDHDEVALAVGGHVRLHLEPVRPGVNQERLPQRVAVGVETPRVDVHVAAVRGRALPRDDEAAVRPGRNGRIAMRSRQPRAQPGRPAERLARGVETPHVDAGIGAALLPGHHEAAVAVRGDVGVQPLGADGDLAARPAPRPRAVQQLLDRLGIENRVVNMHLVHRAVEVVLRSAGSVPPRADRHGRLDRRRGGRIGPLELNLAVQVHRHLARAAARHGEVVPPAGLDRRLRREVMVAVVRLLVPELHLAAGLPVVQLDDPLGLVVCPVLAPGYQRLRAVARRICPEPQRDGVLGDVQFRPVVELQVIAVAVELPLPFNVEHGPPALVRAHVHNRRRAAAAVGGVGIVDEAWIAVQIGRQRRRDRVVITRVDARRAELQAVVAPGRAGDLRIPEPRILVDVPLAPVQRAARFHVNGRLPAGDVAVADGQTAVLPMGVHGDLPPRARRIAVDDAVRHRNPAVVAAVHPAAAHGHVSADGVVGERDRGPARHTAAAHGRIARDQIAAHLDHVVVAQQVDTAAVFRPVGRDRVAVDHRVGTEAAYSTAVVGRDVGGDGVAGDRRRRDRVADDASALLSRVFENSVIFDQRRGPPSAEDAAAAAPVSGGRVSGNCVAGDRGRTAVGVHPAAEWRGVVSDLIVGDRRRRVHVAGDAAALHLGAVSRDRVAGDRGGGFHAEDTRPGEREPSGDRHSAERSAGRAEVCHRAAALLGVQCGSVFARVPLAEVGPIAAFDRQFLAVDEHPLGINTRSDQDPPGRDVDPALYAGEGMRPCAVGQGIAGMGNAHIDGPAVDVGIGSAAVFFEIRQFVAVGVGVWGGRDPVEVLVLPIVGQPVGVGVGTYGGRLVGAHIHVAQQDPALPVDVQRVGRDGRRVARVDARRIGPQMVIAGVRVDEIRVGRRVAGPFVAVLDARVCGGAVVEVVSVVPEDAVGDLHLRLAVVDPAAEVIGPVSGDRVVCDFDLGVFIDVDTSAAVCRILNDHVVDDGRGALEFAEDASATQGGVADDPVVADGRRTLVVAEDGAAAGVIPTTRDVGPRDVAAGDRKPAHHRGPVFAAVEVETAVVLLLGALAVDDAVLRTVGRADGDRLAQEVDVPVAAAGVRAVQHDDGIAVGGCLDGLLNGVERMGPAAGLQGIADVRVPRGRVARRVVVDVQGRRPREPMGAHIDRVAGNSRPAVQVGDHRSGKRRVVPGINAGRARQQQSGLQHLESRLAGGIRLPEAPHSTSPHIRTTRKRTP